MPKVSFIVQSYENVHGQATMLRKLIKKINFEYNIFSLRGEPRIEGKVHYLSFKIIMDEDIKIFGLKKTLINKLHPIVHFHSMDNFSNTLLFLFVSYFKKTMVTYHGMITSNKLNFKTPFYWLRKLIAINISTLLGEKNIFLTHAQKTSYRKFCLCKSTFDQKSEVINNFIEEETIVTQKINYNTNIIYVGRYTKFKGFDNLLSIANQFRKYPIKFHFVGYGALKSKIPINQNIIDYGKVDNQKILKIYDRCSIFILPSFTEVFPVTILEAMARGLVVLASDLPGINEIIKNNQNGYLFDPHNIDKITELIIKLIHNPKLIKKISQNNISKVCKYSCKSISEKYEKIYNEINYSNKIKKR